MMIRNWSFKQNKLLQLLRGSRVKNRRIIFGLKSDSSSRDILLMLLKVVADPGDCLTAVHVQENDDHGVDLNTFHIHEDLCKSKQVDFLVKVSNGDSYISQLCNEVRVSYATVLAIGCSSSGPKYSVVNEFVKALPPTCTLLIMETGGKVLFQRQGTSQQGSIHVSQVPDFQSQKPFQRLALLEATGHIRHFMPQELIAATNNFCLESMIEEGDNSTVYRAKLKDNQLAAVKVLKVTRWSLDVLFEVELLSNLKHNNIVAIKGYCYSNEVQAVVYSLLSGNLKQNLKQMKWSERMVVAIGVAKAIDYLHHCCEPLVIHNNVKSSNILLSDDLEPKLSGFEAATVVNWSKQVSANVIRPFNVDEKIDVYAFGVVLLELITGKEASESNQTNEASLVLWGKSLFSSGLCDRLIDSYLNGEYKKDEMEKMMCAARLCILHSSSERPRMKTIVRLFEEPEYWLKTNEEDILGGFSSKGLETDLSRHHNESSCNATRQITCSDDKICTRRSSSYVRFISCIANLQDISCIIITFQLDQFMCMIMFNVLMLSESEQLHTIHKLR